MFERIVGGAYFALLTEKAKSLADTDKIARAAFDRLCSEQGITLADPHDWDALASRTTDPDHVEVTPVLRMTVAVRVTDEFVVIHGLTYRERWEALHAQYGPLVPTSQLLSISEWLLSFPHLWAATPEEDQCPTRTERSQDSASHRSQTQTPESQLATTR